MRILHILPELTEGGVERHVLAVANGQAELGHRVWVVSAGGRLTSKLSDQVRHIELPVDRKNVFTGLRCAARLGALLREERIRIVHAHSRVPAWIALFARTRAAGGQSEQSEQKTRFVFTAHALFSKNFGLRPIAHADGVLCVSEAVRDDLAAYLPRKAPVRVIRNARPENAVPWVGGGGAEKKLLFVGRLSEKKGVATLLDALAAQSERGWSLRLCGDGPMRGALIERAAALEISDKIEIPGYADDVPEVLARSDLFLFPSHAEGLPLALIEALAAGAPILASDIPAVRELVTADGGSEENLLPPGDVGAWRGAIAEYLSGARRPSLSLRVPLPSQREMVAQIMDFYQRIFENMPCPC